MSASASDAANRVVDFSDLLLSAPESHWNGAAGEGGFSSEGFFFPNFYTDWGGGFYSWAGFAYSNHTDIETPGYGNQYSAFASAGIDAETAPVYAVAYTDGGEIEIAGPRHHGFAPHSIRVTNTTYVALSMREGDDFAKKFGGEHGTDPDTFVLTIEGLDAAGAVTGAVEFYLADFRGDKADIVDEWTAVDLTALGNGLRALRFSLESTDIGDFGMNTPAYFAIGSLTATVAPSIFPGASAGIAAKLFRDGFGSYDDTYYPWIWHSFWGWVYWPGEQPESGVFFWRPGTGWIYGNVDAGGYFYSFEGMRWWLYQESGGRGSIFDFEDRKWIDSPPYSEP